MTTNFQTLYERAHELAMEVLKAKFGEHNPVSQQRRPWGLEDLDLGILAQESRTLNVPEYCSALEKYINGLEAVRDGTVQLVIQDARVIEREDRGEKYTLRLELTEKRDGTLFRFIPTYEFARRVVGHSLGKSEERRLQEFGDISCHVVQDFGISVSAPCASTPYSDPYIHLTGLPTYLVDGNIVVYFNAETNEKKVTEWLRYFKKQLCERWIPSTESPVMYPVQMILERLRIAERQEEQREAERKRRIEEEQRSLAGDLATRLKGSSF
ncbi:TPA: hypothetical protein HA253_00380 [Candidatus Woesearchaeota archaeon]|nr:hypothetical protein [Candidatus Woesearchaeota archaeon]